jgi:hypothetical protein
MASRTFNTPDHLQDQKQQHVEHSTPPSTPYNEQNHEHSTINTKRNSVMDIYYNAPSTPNSTAS